MNASINNPNRAVAKVLFAVAALTLLVAGTGCDVYGLGSGLGGFDPSGMIGGSIDYAHDVMDWSAQSWSDVILYDDYIPYSTWDAYDLTYPNY